jgi:excisionase family DNA binding protein
MNEDDVMKVDEVADRMRVNRRTVQSWIDSGELVAVDVRPEGASRAMWRVCHEDLIRFVLDRKTKTEHPSMQEVENLLD